MSIKPKDMPSDRALFASAGYAAQDDCQIDLSTTKIGTTSTIELMNQARLENIPQFRFLDSNDKENVRKIFSNLDLNLSTEKRLELITSLISSTDPNGNMMHEQKFGGKNVLQLLKNLAEVNSLDSRLETRGYNKGQVLSELIATLSDKGSAVQSDKASCMGCNLEYALLARSKNGGDIARTVACVTSLAMSGSFRTERALFELPSQLATDQRSSVSNLLQSAFMNYASDHGYNAITDMVKGKNGEHKGLFSRQVEKLYEDFTGRAFTRIDKGDPRFLSTMNESSKNGTVNVVCIHGLSASGQDVLHAVEHLETKSDGYTYFRNPWGRIKLRDGQGGAKLVDANESIYRLRTDEFLARSTYIMAEGGTFGITAGASDEREQPMAFSTVSTMESARKDEPKTSNAGISNVSKIQLASDDLLIEERQTERKRVKEIAPVDNRPRRSEFRRKRYEDEFANAGKSEDWN